MDQYRIKWKYRESHLNKVYYEFYQNSFLCDVTILADKKKFRAHSLVLATCSTYFKDILSETTPGQQPFICLQSVRANDMQCILEYMYKGETVVASDSMGNFFKTCEFLCVNLINEDTQNSNSSITSTPVTANQKLVPGSPSWKNISRQRNISSDSSNETAFVEINDLYLNISEIGASSTSNGSLSLIFPLTEKDRCNHSETNTTDARITDALASPNNGIEKADFLKSLKLQESTDTNLSSVSDQSEIMYKSRDESRVRSLRRSLRNRTNKNSTDNSLNRVRKSRKRSRPLPLKNLTVELVKMQVSDHY